MIKHFTLQFLHLSARKLLTVQHGTRLPIQEEKVNEHAQNTKIHTHKNILEFRFALIRFEVTRSEKFEAKISEKKRKNRSEIL
jgi:hypothetical protein